MNLESVTAELRPRGSWEATDFGARMVRRDSATIYKVWFALTLPLIGLATALIIWTPLGKWVQLGYWWVEPLMDGPILYIISRRLFGETTSVSAALRAIPGIIRGNWIFLLTPLRFHFARSVAMPVVQLEQLKGKRRRARAKVLNQVTMNHGAGVTAAYQHLVLAIYLGLIGIGFALVPEGFHDSLGLTWFNKFFQDQDTATLLLNLYLFYIAQSALQPWFIGAGFGLYINCRTMLEAWDVEVAFRRMLQRRANRSGAIAATVLLLLIVVPGWSRAQEVEIEASWNAETVAAAVETVYERDDFRDTETNVSWERLDRIQKAQAEQQDSADLFRKIGRVVSLIAEFGLWLLAAIAMVVIVLTSSRWLPYLKREPRVRQERQRVILASGEISAAALPDDIPGTVLALWQDGRKRDAVSLLYRGSVLGAVERHGVRLPNSATEGACLTAVEEQSSQMHTDFFSRVVNEWIWYAYGSREPASDSIAMLCREWPSHYGAAT